MSDRDKAFGYAVSKWGTSNTPARENLAFADGWKAALDWTMTTTPSPISDQAAGEPVGYVNEKSLTTLDEHSSIGLVAKADSFRALPLFRVAAAQSRGAISEAAFLEVAEWTAEIGYAINFNVFKKLLSAKVPGDV